VIVSDVPKTTDGGGVVSSLRVQQRCMCFFTLLHILCDLKGICSSPICCILGT
jgi:hypothetical protein